MSEIYGDCPRCKGKGEVICPVLFVKVECGACLGTGGSGCLDDAEQ